MLNLIESLSPRLKGTIAFICLLIACFIAAKAYNYNSLIVINRSVSYFPTLVPTGLAVLLTLPVLRADLFSTHPTTNLDKAITFANASMLLFLTAALIKMALGTGDVLWKPATFIVLAIAVVSNINPNRYGELALIASVALSAWNLAKVDTTMEGWGFFFIFFFYVGTFFSIDVRKVVYLISSNTEPESQKNKSLRV